MDLSTAGIKLAYCVEASAGTRPTSGYTELVGVKEIPTIGSAPGSLDSTTLNATTYKTAIADLMDAGGSVTLKFNNNNEFMTAWEALVTAYTTAKASNKATWFAVIIPGMTKGFFFTGDPSELPFESVSVGKVLEASAYVTVSEVAGWESKATLAS